ncbi:MAG: c-type cytochrome domain-containing protein [Myxococcota bacterium]|nr:c-type cytochrome domain-containing protein [Myxococcota bacterium]
MRWTTAAVIALVATAGGCLDPDVGGLEVPFCVDEDGDPSVDVSFSADIMPLFERTIAGCTWCHSPNASDPVGITVGGLDLSSHKQLMKGGSTSSGTIVVAGAPCVSVLYLKLTTAPGSGSRMPRNGPPHFTTEELQLVHDWIAEGGLDN